MKKLFTIVLLIYASISTAQSPEALLAKAEKAYNASNFNETIQFYETILREGKESFELYYNLGNAYYRSNQLGKAILNYERARKLNAQDEDLMHNLQLAEQRRIDKIDQAPHLFLSHWWNRIVDSLSEKTWSIVFILCFSSFIMSLLLFLNGKKVRIRKVGFATAIPLLLLSVGFFFCAKAAFNQSNEKAAIITAAVNDVYAEPNNKSSLSFILHEGTKVNILETSSDYCKIKLPNGNTGWISSTALEGI